MTSITKLLVNAESQIRFSRYCSTAGILKKERNELDEIAKKIGIKVWDDWYKVSVFDLPKNLLKKYDYSVQNMITSIYKENQWEESLFKKPEAFLDAEKQLNLLESISTTKRITKPTDWYEVSRKDILAKEGGEELLRLYDNEPSKLITSILSHYQLKPFLFSQLPHNFWKKKQNQKDFLEYVAKEVLSINYFEDWYKISEEQFKEHGGNFVLRENKGSLYRALTENFPDFHWNVSKFINKPPNCEVEIAKHRLFFDYLQSKLKLSSWEDWYSITYDTIVKNEGKDIMDQFYGGSVVRAMITGYPEHSWQVFRFKDIPKNYWNHTRHQREYLQFLANRLNFRHREDWYQIQKSDFLNNYGQAIMTLYNYSPSKAVMLILSEFKWKSFQFQHLPHSFFDERENRIEVMEHIAERMNIKEWSDWYRVSSQDIIDNNGKKLLKYFGNSLVKTITSVYPDHKWVTDDFKHSRKSERS